MFGRTGSTRSHKLPPTSAGALRGQLRVKSSARKLETYCWTNPLQSRARPGPMPRVHRADRAHPGPIRAVSGFERETRCFHGATGGIAPPWHTRRYWAPRDVSWDSVRTKWYFAHTEPCSIRVQSERANHCSLHASHHCWGRLMTHTVDVPPPNSLRRVPDAYTLVGRRHFPTAYRRGAALAACSDLQAVFR